MLIKNINPFVRQFVTGHLAKCNSYDISNRIKTYDHRLFYIISGFGEMVICGRTYPLHPGTVVLFPSGTEYMWIIDDIKYYCINFDYTQATSHITRGFHPVHSESFDECAIFEKVFFDDAQLLNKPVIIDCAPSIEHQMKAIASEYYMSDDYSALLISSLLKSLIITILSSASKERNRQKNKETLLVKEIIEYLNTNYNKALPNAAISDIFHFHPVYINRIFKKHMNITLHEFLINCRLNAAMEILRSQNISVNETAELIGFSSAAYFSRMFKKRTGKTPSEYADFS